MAMVIRVRFKRAAKLYDFDPNGLDLHNGMSVVTETARGVELGECMSGIMDVPDERLVLPLKPIIRIATEQDLEIQRSNEQAEKEAFNIALDRIAEHKLEMKLVDVEYAFDHSKIIFYFTANGRVDFRMLVKSLASIFKTRIELRQIGVRDEAKMIGGLGCCGRELCCSSYLDDFHPVSINMAKDQNLSLNPAKISGVCGRLMCCLKYEHEAYAELQKVTPRQGSVVDTPEGRGKVISTQMLRGTCKVQLDDSPEHSLTEFQCTQCCMVKGACRNRQNAAAMAEERRKREDQEDAAAPAPKKDAPKKSETPHQKPQQPRPPRKPAPQQTAGDELPEDAQNEPSPDGEGAPRRRRRRGGRRRRKPNGENGAPEQNSGEE